MAFEHALVTKGLMIFVALTSIAVGVLDVKHNFHLQLVPHLSKHHQYWRLLAHHVACAIHIERAFGSVKYSSFLLIALVMNTTATMLTQLLFQLFPIFGPIANHIPPGPTALVFSILYQFFRLVPEAYKFRVFGVTMSDKFWVYGTASQLALAHTPATLITASVGLICGYIYRSDMIQLKGWRLSHRIVTFSKQWIEPLLGDERIARRTNRVFPVMPASIAARITPNEVVTTARPARTQSVPPARRSTGMQVAGERPTDDTTASNSNATGVVRQWVSELTGAARPGGSSGVRVPNETEIQMLTSMFPDVGRDVILGVLQRSPNLETATETLLRGSRA